MGFLDFVTVIFNLHSNLEAFRFQSFLFVFHCRSYSDCRMPGFSCFLIQIQFHFKFFYFEIPLHTINKINYNYN